MGRQHAVVIGASIAGMCAARVLSDHYAKVTVFERDDLPDQPANRSAVPQGKHVHLLMARGAAEFEGLFPGLLDDMVAAGVPILENRPDCIHFGAAGHVLGTQTTLRDEFTAYVPSRPHLEWQIRRRALAIPNVELVRRGIAEPQFDPAEERVTGVLLETGDESSAVRRRPGRRRDRTRHPAAGVVGAVGLRAARPRTPSTSASATPPTRCTSPTV